MSIHLQLHKLSHLLCKLFHTKHSILPFANSNGKVRKKDNTPNFANDKGRKCKGRKEQIAKYTVTFLFFPFLLPSFTSRREPIFPSLFLFLWEIQSSSNHPKRKRRRRKNYTAKAKVTETRRMFWDRKGRRKTLRPPNSCLVGKYAGGIGGLRTKVYV